MATCVLHNYLTEDACYWTEDENEVSHTATQTFHNLQGIGGNSAQEALEIRERFKNYFTSENGSVDWQLKAVRRGRRMQ
ncbi:hypothetical protein NQ314_001319 [Rhamnusium bicolor]|uniref:Uncharacterized protein n=1 Tax=Rhamnusium bicolor TaxID=1586634 RepID=A0AAV8ZSI7_9CUCU|nr:hypothetical protein NQ314_001319 [Rhamnusium bicolor]